MIYRYWCMTLCLALFGVYLTCATAAAVPTSMTLGYDMDGATAGIQNPHPHNLSSGNTDGGGIHGGAGDSDEVCKFCHTPHGGSAKGPLWNRTDPTGPGAGGTFPLYTGAANLKAIPASQYNATVASDASLYPNGSSRLCMSCHDGVTAVGEVIVGGELATLTMSAFGTIDLSSSHPISFVYNATVDAALPATFRLPTSSDPVALQTISGETWMQCTTCHDPHNDTKSAGYTYPMWRAYGSGADENEDYDNTCESCHQTNPGPPSH